MASLVVCDSGKVGVEREWKAEGRESYHGVPGEVNCVEFHVCKIMEHVHVEREG